MDFRSPDALCALAMTVLASCAIAFTHRNAMQIVTTANFFNTASSSLPLSGRSAATCENCTYSYHGIRGDVDGIGEANSINVPRSAAISQRAGSAAGATGVGFGAFPSSIYTYRRGL